MNRTPATPTPATPTPATPQGSHHATLTVSFMPWKSRNAGRGHKIWCETSAAGRRCSESRLVCVKIYSDGLKLRMPPLSPDFLSPLIGSSPKPYFWGSLGMPPSPQNSKRLPELSLCSLSANRMMTLAIGICFWRHSIWAAQST